MIDLEFIAEKLKSAQPFTLELDPFTAFTIVGLMQLALRHPLMESGEGAEVARELGRQIQTSLGDIDTTIFDALEWGWNPELDMTEAEYAEFKQTGQLPHSASPDESD